MNHAGGLSFADRPPSFLKGISYGQPKQLSFAE